MTTSRHSAIAVIVPCHNYGHFAGEALRSIAGQSEPPAEVLVIDDGSTDGSLAALQAICNELSGVLPLRLLSQPQRGLAATVARGFAETKSACVVLVSADDRVGPRFLESLSRALEADPRAGFAYPKMALFGDERGVCQSYPWSLDRLIFDHNYVPGIALVRRDAYAATRGMRELRAHEDWDLWLSFAESGFHGVFVPEVLYEWRRHGGARNLQPARVRVGLRIQILATHRSLVLRRWRSAIPWSVYAVARRLFQRVPFRVSGSRRSKSCWVEAA